MRHDHHRHTLGVEAAEQAEHARARYRIQHRSKLIEDQTPGLHGQQARDGQASLFPGGKRMWVAFIQPRQADTGQRHIHALADFPGGYTHILGAKGHLILHSAHHELVVGILKDHSHRGTNRDSRGRIMGAQAIHVYMACRGQQEARDATSQRGLARPV